jgi:hypothetical protein
MVGFVRIPVKMVGLVRMPVRMVGLVRIPFRMIGLVRMPVCLDWSGCRNSWPGHGKPVWLAWSGWLSSSRWLAWWGH